MRFNDAVIGIFLIAFGALALFLTRGFPTLSKGYPGPSLFPNVIAVLFMITGLILIAQGIRSKRPWLKVSSSLQGRPLANIVAVMLVIIAYIYLSDFLGFVILSFILLFLLMLCFKVRLLWNLLMASSVTVLIYLLFVKFLMVPLPGGPFDAVLRPQVLCRSLSHQL